jgi:hypothetical protein
MDESEAALGLDLERLLVRLGIGVAMQHDLRTARGDRVDLDARRGDRHHDDRATAEPLRRERHPLRMIAGARRDYAARKAVAR